MPTLTNQSLPESPQQGAAFMFNRFHFKSTEAMNALPVVISRYMDDTNETLPPWLTLAGEMFYNIPASQWRGALRRAAVFYAILPKLLAAGVKFSVDEINYLSVGGVKDDESTGAAKPEKIAAARRANPVIDLYGAGWPVFMAGGLRMGPMISRDPFDPKAVETMPGSVRRPPSTDQSISTDFFSDADSLERRNTMNSERSSLLKLLAKADPKSKKSASPEKVIAEANAKHHKSFETLEEIQDYVKEIQDTYGSVSPQMPLAGAPCIPAQTRMMHEFDLEWVGDLSCGLMIEAMHLHALNRDAIGGHKARGAGGYITAEYAVTRLDGRQWVPDCRFKVTPGLGVEFIDAPGKGVLRQCHEQWIASDVTKLDLSIPSFK